MQRVKVVTPTDFPTSFGTECYIDGNKVNNVLSVDFRVAVDEIPCFTFETIGIPDIDMSGDVQFRFTPETVQQAAIVLRNEFSNNPQYREALAASIQSAIKDAPSKIRSIEFARVITDRIIGLEK